MNNEDINNKIERKHKKNKVETNIILFLIFLLLIFIILITYKIGIIGEIYIKTSGTTSYDTKEIILTDFNGNICKDDKLDIFNNKKYNNKKIIAPNSVGMCKFYVNNKTDNDIIYNIKFIDEMSKFVNMKYKLKLNNVYIRGTKDNYISLNELDVNDIISEKNTKSLYTLEWNWEDNNELDKIVGTSNNDEYYTLRINILASQLNNN